MSKYIIGLILLTLTTLVTSSKAETTCVTNTLGDRTCTTVTSGTTTGNVLDNSTFGTGSSTTTTGWQSDHSSIHTHGNFGNFPYQSGMDTSGGVWAGDGHSDHNAYQDVDLVGDGHLTKSQINEGFTSTQSADVWFWNNLENDFTLKQTITAADGTVTTQTRVINDHDPNRAFNGGTFENYTNVYTESANSQNDYTIRVEMYNETAGTAYDNSHRGPDVDNVQLSITTAGTTSVVVTSCQQLGTCTTIGDDINEAIDLETDDGRPITDVVDEQIIDAIEEIDELFFTDLPEFTPEVDFNVIIEDDYGIEEIPFEEFIVDTFTEFLDTNNLTQDFQQELIIEDISEQEFFDELSDQMVMEIGGDMIEMFDEPPLMELPMPNDMPSDMVMTETEMNDFIEANPDMVEIVDENTILIKPPEDMRMTELPDDNIELEEPTMETEPNMEETPNEEIIEENTTEENMITERPNKSTIKEEPTETETNEEPNATSNDEPTTETSATEETMETDKETEPTRQENEDVSTESEVAENKETEGQTEKESDVEAVEDETDVDVKDRKVVTKDPEIGKKVARIIKKLEAKLKRVDDKIKATSYVLAVTLQNLQPDMGGYINKRIYNNQASLVGVPNDDFFDKINILEQQQIYKDANLNAYSSNDPIAVRARLLTEIESKKNQLKAEIAALRSIE